MEITSDGFLPLRAETVELLVPLPVELVLRVLFVWRIVFQRGLVLRDLSHYETQVVLVTHSISHISGLLSKRRIWNQDILLFDNTLHA